MKLKESIYNSITKMNIDELTLLYEQIKLFERLRIIVPEKESIVSIEKVHEMTG